MMFDTIYASISKNNYMSNCIRINHVNFDNFGTKNLRLQCLTYLTSILA